MLRLMFALASLSLQMPEVDNFRDTAWQPEYTEPADVQLEKPVVALLTHCSQGFDPLNASAQGVQQTVAGMKAAGLPVVYLHDRYNSNNPVWMYLYNDWKPTAFVRSDVGHIKLRLDNVRHVICLGGYFGQCERSTVTDVMGTWSRQPDRQDLRLTQIVDGIFTVGQHIRYADSYSSSVRDGLMKELKSRHPKAVITVDQIIRRIDDVSQVPELLKRQVPPVPGNVNVVMDVFGTCITLQAVSASAPTLTLAYRRSDDFLKYKAPEVDSTASRRWHPPPQRLW